MFTLDSKISRQTAIILPSCKTSVKIFGYYLNIFFFFLSQSIYFTLFLLLKWKFLSKSNLFRTKSGANIALHINTTLTQGII